MFLTNAVSWIEAEAQWPDGRCVFGVTDLSAQSHAARRDFEDFSAIALKRNQAGHDIPAEAARARTMTGISETEIAAYLGMTVDEVRAMLAEPLKKRNSD